MSWRPQASRPHVLDALQGRCAGSGAREWSVAHTLSPASLRAQRSNPELLRGGRLDCFAALAMTEQGAASPPPACSLNLQTQLRILAAYSPELCFVTSPSCPRGHREGRVPAGTRGPPREKHTQENRTAAYRCSQSLGLPCAMVGRLMPCSPGSRVPFWPPSPSRNSPTPRRLTQMPHPPGLDRSNDGQDHTVLPYARLAISPQYSQPCRRSRKLTDETKPSSAARRHEALGSRRAIRPALSLSYPNAAASTASPARERDDHKIAPQG